MTKAAVFPDPVGAEARISRPKNRLHNMKENKAEKEIIQQH
jgi:hypothetical protein